MPSAHAADLFVLDVVVILNISIQVAKYWWHDALASSKIPKSQQHHATCTICHQRTSQVGPKWYKMY